MHRDDLTFKTHDTLELFARRWLPEGEPRAVVALVHGIGEHCDRYTFVVDALVAGGYAVWGMDHRGHGRSPGPRGHIDAWSDYRQDVVHYLNTIRQRHPAAPIFLYGHSMGALIALDYLIHTTEERTAEPPPAALAGAIISGAPVALADPPKLLVAMAKALSGVWPRLALSPGLSVEQSSRVPEVIEADRVDTLTHDKATARWGTEFLKTIAAVRAHRGTYPLPLLIVHGGEDPICDPSGTIAWAEGVDCPDKTVNLYDHSLHEIHNDQEHAALTADVAAWLDAHLSPSD